MIRLVSMSGGKDSTACLLLALERHPKDEVKAVFADTGNEHPAVYEYIDYLERVTGVTVHRLKEDFSDWWWRKREYIATKWPEKGVPQGDVDRALTVFDQGPTGNPYLDLCIIKSRFPSRKAQFCTQYLKTRPLTEYALELIDQYGAVESWQGVRADESASRANLPEREDQGGGLTVYRPIHKWTAQEVFALHHKHGVDPNPLYKQGMGRVGCMPCINANKNEVREIWKRFPEHIERINEWEKVVGRASKRQHATFFAGANKGENLTSAEAYERGNIWAIVEWSKTRWGGKEIDPAALDEPTGCSSAYGLCDLGDPPVEDDEEDIFALLELFQ
jgi:3'-phosphoadenosine 5'-phosphosulfate sulfotransferase (PAPS reductase)/FAD synthetase